MSIAKQKYDVIDDDLLREIAKINEPIELARRLGEIVDGWGIIDYLHDAIENNGYELVLIWGKQGSGKSSFMLYLAYQLLGDWNKVLDALCFKPTEIIDKYDRLPENKRYDVLLWDDVGVHFPSTMYRTNVDIYEAVGRMLDVNRTKASVIICTAPNLERYPKVMIDNWTMQIYMKTFRLKKMWAYYKAIYKIEDIDFSDERRPFKKYPLIEHGFYHFLKVPNDVWSEYWRRRLSLGKEAIEVMRQTINPNEEEKQKTIENNNEKTITLLKCPNGHVWVPRKRYVFGERVVCNKCGKVFPFKEENIIKINI